MPALLERPKLSNAMARALHKHIMRERERKRQEEEEVDKMMEQKMKEEEERKRKKEMEERMSLEETKEQIMKMGEKLQGLQEEKHQLFLQLKKVLHEEEKRRRKEQSDMTTLTSAAYQPNMAIHSGQHLLSMQASPVSHGRPAALLGERNKQLFQPPVISGRGVCWSLSQRSLGRMQDTPWTGRQSIAGQTDRHTQSLTHSHLGQCSTSNWPDCMSLDCGRKPENPEETHADTRRTCRLHTERTPGHPAGESNPDPPRCEATALP
ncbi:hypothetical protein SRHO_G00294500, partial [Serrasalmus rhombeus]